MITNKRYSVFISSTFKDLREERRAVQDTVISAGDFPVQMESFPAADEDQFEFIKTLIDKCDFYVLIVAGRYGTPAEDGISYTEKEYRYALFRNIPVLVLLRSNIEELPVNKSEDSEKGKKRLQKFRSEVEMGRLRKTWTTTDGLKLKVREALDHAKATKNAIGWVRGDTTAQLEVLEDLSKAHKENASYRKIIGQLEIDLALPPIPDANSTVELELLPHTRKDTAGVFSEGSYAKIKTSWIEAFPAFFSNLSWSTNDWNGEDFFSVDQENSCLQIGSAMASELADFDTSGLFTLSKPAYQRLHSYFVEVGLMREDGETPFSPSGKRLARRQRIAASQSSYNLVAGIISFSSSQPSSSDFDDEIPF
ncbi:DUF4062 domain-containing protein [Lentibacter algarum]|jgi:hypothetical protein|uniref:DUF4062 domain-containing protein n=1 Tax=Lentibacter algarum TaxID=576131 RepID=UPI00249023D4|nr:DUF4062 domain-containing protein [Lentibacter algarum]